MTMNGMFDEKSPPVTLDQMITCVKREIAMRKSAYPKWVKRGHMQQHSADNEIRLMQGVLDLLHRLKAAGADDVALANADAIAGLATFNKAFKEHFGG